MEHHSHEAKSTILYDFYISLLDTHVATEWRFSHADLYPTLVVSHLPLSDPFTPDELSKALFTMDMNSSPGPDGFGPTFYKLFWSSLNPLVMQIFHNFHSGVIDLDGLNQVHLILLPKHEGVCTPDGFQPISLQNYPMKLFSKVMANRLKAAIPNIVDTNQTGFVQGRHIAEKFVYAADLLRCCYTRKAPTGMLKLDFKKAFDSVSWDSLDSILACRGFDARWRMWVSLILSSGKTAVMLNGVPSCWIIVQMGSSAGGPDLSLPVHHCGRCSPAPYSDRVSPSLPCPVLQYVDDTFILLKGDLPSVIAPKTILENFSAATGLAINFHKSTFVPLNLPGNVAATMASVLGCVVSSFPQTYLGLPLSPHKIRVADYQPLISKFDKFLASWKARLLSTGGRLILVNAVWPFTICRLPSSPKRFWTSWTLTSAPSCGPVRENAMAQSV